MVLTEPMRLRLPGLGQTPHAVAAPITIPAPTAAQSARDLGKRVIGLAETWLGVPYVFGGCSRAGVDCSCLITERLRGRGLRLPRVAVDQFNATMPTADPLPGDLVFFANTYQPGISHVGIYIGNGLQINAPRQASCERRSPVLTGCWGAHYAVHRVDG
jgi:peptidoglycan endopeptidase LytE